MIPLFGVFSALIGNIQIKPKKKQSQKENTLLIVGLEGLT